MTVQALDPGFADPVSDAQAIFRAVMMALARPGSIQPLRTQLTPSPPLTPELAAVALALVDHETALWLDAPLAASAQAGDFLRFHTGVRMVDAPSAAAFALITDFSSMPALSTFAHGTDEYPDRSATLVISVGGITNQPRLILEGPGIKRNAFLSVEGLPTGFVTQLSENHARFPRGVDCILVAPGAVAALPRSTCVKMG